MDVQHLPLMPIRAVILVRESPDAKRAKVLLPVDKFPRRGENPAPVIDASDLAVVAKARAQAQLSAQGDAAALSEPVLVFDVLPILHNAQIPERLDSGIEMELHMPLQALVSTDSVRAADDTPTCGEFYVLVTRLQPQVLALSEAHGELLAPFLRNPRPDSQAWRHLARCALEYSPEDTQWLRNLAAAKTLTKKIFDDDDESTERARLGLVAVAGPVPAHHPFHEDMPSTALFIRTVYHELFTLLFALEDSMKAQASRSVVIGNPGTGKSWLHIFIIWRLLCIHRMAAQHRPELFLPSCIVQQLGHNSVFIYDLVNATVWRAHLTDNNLLLDFSREHAIYMFDPALEPDSKPMQTNLRSIVTTSPKRIRVKEWSKEGSACYYMPVWSKEELLIAGTWRLDALATQHVMRRMFFPTEIAKRFEQFGGIIRHVLPFNSASLDKAIADQAAAMANVTFQKMFAVGAEVDDREENHSYHIFHYRVSPDLKSFRLMFPCRYVEIQLREKVAQVKFEEALEQVVQAMNGNLPERMRLLLETVTYGLLARKVDIWQLVDHVPFVPRDEVFHFASLTYPGTKHTLGTIMERLNSERYRQRFPRVSQQRFVHTHDFPGVDAMEEDTLYIFGQSTFPFVEAVYKRKGVIYGIQCKTGLQFERFSPATCLKFRRSIGAECHTPVVIWLVCTPRNVGVWQAALHRQTRWAEVTETVKTKNDHLWPEQVLACESTVFSVVAHSLKPEDVRSGDLDSATMSMEGANPTEIDEPTESHLYQEESQHDNNESLHESPFEEDEQNFVF